MQFPNRQEIVSPAGKYDPSREPLWEAALDFHYADLPQGEALADWPHALSGAWTEQYKGRTYLRGWDPAVHPTREKIEADAQAWADLERDRIIAEQQAGEQRAEARYARRNAIRAWLESGANLNATIARHIARELLGE